MGKISTYPKDTNVTGLDILLGSDANTPGKITKNFSTNALASYFNKSAIIDTGQFSWEFLPYNNTQPQPEKTFMKVDWLDDTININNLAGVLRVSALTLGNTQPGAFIENEWVGNNILIHLPSAPSAYAIYTVDALVPDGDWYYLMTISYVGGQSFVIQKNEPVVMGYFAGANVITEITGTFPIIVSEGSIPDVSIDETKLGEWNLAFNSTITSASVTGTTTKTLTLTEQDGGTITASWTDEDTNLVTSVFGRTGAVVAVSGDYNTSQVTESTNLYFTQARAIASPITGYNPTLGTITATDTILTAINKLAGSYVPYTGATNNVNLGEKGITAGYVGFDLTPTTTPTGIGTMYWDAANRTVALVDGDGDTTLQIGQEERILVHNNTGSTLTDGQLVYVTGSTGNLPSVALASAATESTSAATIGMITETILNGADGFITVSGIVNGLNTLAFNEGDLLWLSDTPGGFTTTKPISPSHLVLIGYVIKKAGGNGSVLVKIQNTQELSESSDVLISAPEIDGQGLFLQTISGVQLWRNRSIVDVLGYTPADEATTLTINGTTYDLSANRTWSVGTVTSIAVGLGASGTDVNVSGSPITSSGTITLNIPSASAANRGLLTPTDWTTFNNKQDAGNYITSLTGEATASGPGAAAVTLSTPAVTGKLLTGVNITGGTVVATDTILEAFGKVQNQINGLVGGSIYKGTWNAATNTPAITSGVGNTGWYYIVSVSGSTNIDGITDWNLGDWIIFDGTAWQQVDNTDAVVSVNGYTGAVSLVSSDVPEGLTNLYFTNARARGAVSLTTTGSSGAATYNSDSGVFNIPDYGSALSGYLPLTGGTLTGGLYINPQNTSTVGLDVASNTITFRSDNLEGFKRQLTTTMSSGTLVKIQAAGYGGTYVTDLGFYTSSNSAVNTIPNLYLTGGNNYVGINTDAPIYQLDVFGTTRVNGQLILTSTIASPAYTYTLPSATGTLALTSQIPTSIVTGSGATGRYAIWTSAGVISDGFIQTTSNITYVEGMGLNTINGLDIEGNYGGGTGGLKLRSYDETTGKAFMEFINTSGVFRLGIEGSTGGGILPGSTAYATVLTSGLTAKNLEFGTNNTKRLTLDGTTGAATFTSSVSATNFILSGATGNTGLYYGHTDRVVLANYTTGGIDFEVNGGSIVATLFPSGNYGLGITLDAGYKLDVNGTTRISGALSGTSASFSSSITGASIIKSGGTSSQFLKADGSVDSTSYQPLLTNPVTGTGTSGIVAVFNGTSSITDSTIYANSTRVSIGADVTTSNKFTAVASTSSSYAIVAQASSAAHGIWSNVLGTGEIFRGQTAGGSYFIINNGGNAFLNGNLNIGDFASTSYRLNVVGTANFTGALSGTSATFKGIGIFDNSASGDANSGIRIVAPIGTTHYNWMIGAQQNVNTGFEITPSTTVGGTTFSTPALTILQTGAATFSSSVTATNLYTSYTAAYSAEFYRNNAADSRINLTNTTTTSGADKGLMLGEIGVDSYFYNYATGAAIFGTSSTERMRITSSGNVGIGTTSPTSLLDVKSSTPAISINSTNTSNASTLLFKYSDSYVAEINAVAGSGQMSFNVGPSAGWGGYMSFKTDTSERMRITSSGNVGIGTTSPGTALAVNSGTAGSIVSMNSNRIGGGGIVLQNSGSDRLYLGNANWMGIPGESTSSTAISLSTAENSAIIFATNAAYSVAERMRITSGGNVLIGTTSDSGYGLIVGKVREGGWQTAFVNTASVGTAQVFLSHGDGYGAYIDSGSAGASNARYIFKAVSGGSAKLTIRGDGNVGIGTESPSHLLDVAGNIRSIGSVGSNALLTSASGTTYGFFNNGAGGLTLTNSGVANVGTFNMSTGNYTATSDINKKKDFEESNIGLNEVLQLKPTLYRMKTDNTEGIKELGFIAQEVKNYIPNAYVESGDFIGLNFNPIVAALTKAVQELKAELDKITGKV